MRSALIGVPIRRQQCRGRGPARALGTQEAREILTDDDIELAAFALNHRRERGLANDLADRGVESSRDVRGNPHGAKNPYHDVEVRRGKPRSAKVGTDCSFAERCSPLTASTRTCREAIIGIVACSVPNIIDTCPPRRSFIAGALPR